MLIMNDKEQKVETSAEATIVDNTVLAAGIITAVRDENWEEMLKLFPDGVEYRTWKYNCSETFTEWESYEDYSRYVAPARELMKEKCLNKALEYLNACS